MLLISFPYQEVLPTVLNLISVAWSVSLHPSGETFAATGGSGNIQIHSADPASFGERKTVLPSGRSKFGLFCKHVSVIFPIYRRTRGMDID